MQDLWADYAGEALATREAGRGGGLRRYRLTESTVLMTLRAWLLRDYLLPYGTSLGATRIFQRCYWVDGLGSPRVQASGMPPVTIAPAPENPGKTRRGRQKAATPDPSLPLALQLADETARQLASLERPITLYGFALDEKRGRRKTAENSPSRDASSTAGLTIPRTGGLLPGTWPELAPTLLATLDQSAAVFLLNPLRETLFHYPDLAPLYQRPVPTELFLWLSHKQIETRLLPTLRTPAGAAALTNLLRNDRWKSLLTQAETHPERVIHGLLDLLAESMRPHFLSVQSLAFPVRGGPALVENAPCSLLFATRRQDSLCSLNDAVCKRTRQLQAESQEGILHEEWFRRQRTEQAASSRAALSQEALSVGRGQRIRRWPDLRLQLLLTHFGYYTLAEYDRIITELLAHGDVRCEWRRPALVREGSSDPVPAPVPGKDDVILWTRL